MGLTDLFYRFGVALIIGFLIGLQREYAYEREENRPDIDQSLFAGARTFALLGIYGATAAFAGEIAAAPWATIVLIVLAGLLIVAAYVIDAWKGQIGITTEMAGLMTVLIGALCYWGHVSLAAALGVATMALLTLKLQIQALARGLSREDIFATLKFAIITAIILPILPQEGYGPEPFAILVPYNIWLMVVFISGIGFCGYLLMKFVGPRLGVGLTGLLGGLVSSTAVTLSFSQRSRDNLPLSRTFALGVLAAWAVMFLRVMLIVAVLSMPLFHALWRPLAAMLAACALAGGYLYLRERKAPPARAEGFKNPFELLPAITFGLLYALILLASHAAQRSFGAAGVYLSSIAAGLIDVDAITISMSKLSGGLPGMEMAVASRAVLFAAASNTLVKGSLVLFTASPAMGKLILPGLLATLAAAAMGALLI